MAVGSIQKKGDIFYVVRRIDGKQKWIKAGPKKKDAERILVEIASQLYDGTYQEVKEIGFSDFAKSWLKDYVRGATKESTYSDYENIIRNHLTPFFNDRKLVSITPHDVQAYVSHKVAEGRLKAKTINNTVIVLKQMLKHAVLWGYLRSNPAQYVTNLREEKVEMQFLTIEEVRLLLEHIRAKDPGYYPFFLSAAMTGMRIGELTALKWQDINWASSQIRVGRSLYNGKFTEPKSRCSVRSINMPPMLAKVLRIHQRESIPNEYDLVFYNSVGKPLERHNVVNRHFLPALRRAGVKTVRFHDIRHTHASMLIHQGENIKLIQHQLGHSSIQTTIDKYGHLMPDTFNLSAVRLEKTIFGSENSVRKTLEEPQNMPKLMAEN